MAEAFYRQLGGSYLATSAGTLADDGGQASSSAVDVMDELSIDIRQQTSQRVTQPMIEAADLVVLFPTTYSPPYLEDNPNTIKWYDADPYYSPSGDAREFMHRTRDNIRQQVQALIDQQASRSEVL